MGACGGGSLMESVRGSDKIRVAILLPMCICCTECIYDRDDDNGACHSDC